MVTARRDKAAALKLLKRIMKKYGLPQSIVTDRLRAYSAAMKEICAADRHEVGGRLNNRAENSHQPFRRRERAMQQFRSMKTLQKFSSVHAQVHNQFNQERHLVTRQVYKQRRSVALTEWCAPSRHRSSLASGRAALRVDECCYSDDAAATRLELHQQGGGRASVASALRTRQGPWRRQCADLHVDAGELAGA